MKRLILAVVILLAACIPAQKPVVQAPVEPKSCATPAGTWKVDYAGAIPKNKEILDVLCPTELFLDFRDSKTLELPAVLCGRHVFRNGKYATTTILTSTGATLAGELIMMINLSPDENKPLICFTYLTMTFTRIK